MLHPQLLAEGAGVDGISVWGAVGAVVGGVIESLKGVGWATAAVGNVIAPTNLLSIASRR
ncbi:hypothetical protein [Leptolyngbya sp. 'hensonii']|uniref:hypothetical protein n=1 Tax=Leptolyngbya sp. 'hensonii' TaxID=1922337 RepID=UPI000B1B17B7|nr:hypothetical protein [Leptolyngbya sp. 'hensonii']